jgi:hypothetical protein
VRDGVGCAAVTGGRATPMARPMLLVAPDSHQSPRTGHSAGPPRLVSAVALPHSPGKRSG